ncbi:hypothetical protein ACGFY9_21540 [Streptomyces sp. NPDC048504]|uniref:hypothetical protein n=1 Tax=Streptomyces sp. NPDC048504 TaxID=3365559 RepID=UPI0037166218
MTEPQNTPLQPMPDDWRRALAVVAHPDDLEYGCSAAIAACTDGGRSVGHRPELVITMNHRDTWGGVRRVAVAGFAGPTHAEDATPGLERGVRSLLEHRTYIEALTDEDPETYARELLTKWATITGERFGGKPAVSFGLFAR